MDPMKWNRMPLALVLAALCWPITPADAHPNHRKKFNQKDSFRQLEEILPTPNRLRLGSGAPGPDYWQQKVDYDIDVQIHDDTQRLEGSEKITYFNRSPDTLTYLWVQLDQNRFAHEADSALVDNAPDMAKITYGKVRQISRRETFEGGYQIASVRGAGGRALEHTIVKTMMRIDLQRPLEPGDRFTFTIDWSYNIIEAKAIRGRGGYEYFPDDGSYLYEMAQWFPRMAPYTDVDGWQNKQFLGRGEFALEFGDYTVRITVPDNHVVASTGTLQNPGSALKKSWRRRLAKAARSDAPIFIITPEEATANEGVEAKRTRTWVFEADNVRDFAFASSRKFIWDAARPLVEGKRVWAMSYYPREGEPLWSRFSTHAIIHTLLEYSRRTIPYPYPVAISVNGPVGGMEYPMICFNGPRPEKDGTYSKRTKRGLIGVIIHEVGHNWFPMIINSDERQWTWLDEGLNTFVQYLTEQTWENEYPSWRGEPEKIVGYMTSENQVPIMTNSESLLQFGNNAYAKPATALNILRETILGAELFDFAFQEFARRWAFRRPMPADFFRTLEDASGVDLDWFWRGWFYSTDHVDIAIGKVQRFRMETRDPERDNPRARAEREAKPTTRSAERFKPQHKRTDRYPDLIDFYSAYDQLDVTDSDRREYDKLLEDLEPHEKSTLEVTDHFLHVEFHNLGGVVMPLLLDITYADGSTHSLAIPAEIWRQNNARIARLFASKQPIVRIALDPRRETADADRSNNFFPSEALPATFQLQKREKLKNPMQKARRDEELRKEKAEKEALEKAEKDGKTEAPPEGPPEAPPEGPPETPPADPNSGDTP